MCLETCPPLERTASLPPEHRRRIDLLVEDKAKVVAADWGTESLPR